MINDKHCLFCNKVQEIKFVTQEGLNYFSASEFREKFVRYSFKLLEFNFVGILGVGCEF